MFEVTVNWESNCLKNNKYKLDNYTHFLTEITTYTLSITSFEVMLMGHIIKDEMKRLHEIHRFVKKTIKLHSQTT